MNVTLDVFSALIDSRTGAGTIFDQIAAREHWPLGGEALYAAWDREHKRLQLECRRWQPFAALGRQALEDVLEKHHLVGDVSLAMAELWASVGDWPLWPDVERMLAGRPLLNVPECCPRGLSGKQRAVPASSLLEFLAREGSAVVPGIS